ncbi:MAG: phosphate ABC transporter ATP-binding protein [Chloroflexi bacterium]|nr:phosphate ABC transporter ATP-binding protein [Chloroflexota bacterium]
MSGSHIITDSLCLHYRETRVLADVTVKIPPCQVTAIIGPSGCGKTTLLKCLNRMIDLVPDARVTGRVTVGGQDLYAKGVDITAVRKRIGLIHQKPTPLPMSIFENVAFGPRIHGGGCKKKLRENVEQCLRTVGLWDEVKSRLKDPAARLSIGQQQRLCLARGLAVEPEVLLFDEPTSSLDPNSSMRIEEAIKELRTDYTCVVVTHNLGQARRIADHVLFMYDGRLVEHGTTEDIFDSPQEAQTQAYIMGGGI